MTEINKDNSLCILEGENADPFFEDHPQLDDSHKDFRLQLKKMFPKQFNGHYKEGDINFLEVNDVKLITKEMRQQTKTLFSEEEKIYKQLTDSLDVQNIENEIFLRVLREKITFEQYIPKITDALPYVSDETRAEMIRIYQKMLQRRLVVLTGPTGVAKTAMIKTIAFHTRLPLYQETGGESKTFASLTQKTVVRNGKHKSAVTVPDKLLKAAINGGIYLVDEANNFTGDVQLAVAQIIDDGEILLDNGRRIPVSDKFHIVFTGNKNYEGTKDFDDAVYRRAGGEIDIGYLSPEQEIKTVENLYSQRICKIIRLRGLKHKSRLGSEEIAKITAKFRQMRENVSKLNIKEAATKGGVHFQDAFSIRALVDLLIMADLGKETNFTRLFFCKFSTQSIPPKALKEINKLIIQFPGIVFNPEELEKEEESGVFLDSLKEIEKYLNPDFGSEIPVLSEGSAFGVNLMRDKKPEIRLVGPSKDEQENPSGWGAEDSDLKQKITVFNPALFLDNFFQKAREESIFVPLKELELNFDKKEKGRNPSGYVIEKSYQVEKAYAALYDYAVQNQKPPYVERVKKIVEFEINGIQGFAVIGFAANFRDVRYYDRKNKKTYILNADRQKTFHLVYVRDEKGDSIINPATGQVIRADMENIDEYKGFVRCRCEEISGELHKVVGKRLRKSLSHAESLFENQQGDDENERTIANYVFSAFEGNDISEPPSIESVGRYLKYLTPSKIEELNKIKLAHLAGMTVLLEGPSGTGKSSLAKTYALSQGLPYVPVQFHERSKESNTLKKIQLKDGKVYEMSLPLFQAYKYGWVAELKELNTAYPNDVAFVNALLDDNAFLICEGERISRHPNFLPMITINPYDQEKLHVNRLPLNTSLRNRCGLQLTITYPPADEEADILVATVKHENPDLWEGISKGELEEIIKNDKPTLWSSISRYKYGETPADKMRTKILNDICSMIVKANNFVREKLEIFMDQKLIRDELQKLKLATDALQDMVKSAKTIPEFLEIIHKHFFPDTSYLLTNDAEALKKILEKVQYTVNINAIFADMETYEKIFQKHIT